MPSRWHPDSSWPSQAMSCQTIALLSYYETQLSPIKGKHKGVSFKGQTLPRYTCLFSQTVSLADPHYNGTVTEICIELIFMLIGICI